MLIATTSFAEEEEPITILKRVAAAYNSAKTYSAEGTIVSDIESGGVNTNLETSFSIKLKKPSAYRISWDTKSAIAPTTAQTGAVWSDGTQPYLYIEGMKAYSKMADDQSALGAAVGFSGGAAFTIPALFFSAFNRQPASFSRLIDPKLEANEQVESDDCYVISASSPLSKQEKFWIAKETYWIKKYSRSLEPPLGGVEVPQLTDQQLEAAIKGAGQEVTEERKESMREMVKKAEQTMKSGKLKGMSTELQMKIATHKLVPADFVFKVPAGSVLKDSLFPGVSSSKQPKTISKSAVVSRNSKPSKISDSGIRTRTFTAKNGKTVEAELLGLADGTVKLRRKKDGKSIEVPLATFTDDDQDFIRRHN